MTKTELVKEINEVKKVMGLKEENPERLIKNTKVFLEGKLETLKNSMENK